MILSKTAIVKIHCNTAKYYEDKGYIIPRHKDKYSGDHLISRGAEIEVLVSDLTPKSEALVLWQCPICKETKMRKFYHCRIHCNSCALKIHEVENKHCIDCNKIIQKGATRCHECRQKYIEKNKNRCIDCNKIIKRKSKRCNVCKNLGKNNPAFNPNLTEQDRQDQKYIFGLSKWRKEVLKRDKYECQCCGKKGDIHNGTLNAHHINSFKKYKKLRLNVSNGITLCKDCHNKLHLKHGKITTEKEYKLFLEEYKNGRYKNK